jgi:hypothetical protein
VIERTGKIYIIKFWKIPQAFACGILFFADSSEEEKAALVPLAVFAVGGRIVIGRR